MKKIALTIVCTFLFIINTSAQTPETSFKNYVGIGIGYSLDYINDQNFSPLNQKGNSLFYALFYERHSDNILKIGLKYGDGSLKSGPKDQFDTAYYVASLGVSYFKNLSPSSSATKFYIGGAYNLNVLYMDWFDQDAFSYVTTNGLSVSGAISKRINEKQYVESSLSIPFLQFLSRPPYNGIDESIIENQDDPMTIILDGKLTSLKKYRAINWNVNYNREIFLHFNWKVDYTLNIQKVDDVNEYKSVSNLFSTSIIYKF